ncbi:heavy metal translocating P-type ATPase [Maridesulfovibrio hydrothermalis]|uniref:P-type Zn(2+) transporter n=1 Tax=Maridesulfovibrio hydrothermalis AM13 = DSM 14728 TaxID=1121451 RepID=L0RBJ8_9BACT|nr:heavy metal translocating P-type ATPase [Maridesulfovibrio hydrothermalis]CCO22911.1 Heavy metal translocating P-type ATPase [Maridesulfovibrio hydrothermalis AM13 = DSM 14728]
MIGIPHRRKRFEIIHELPRRIRFKSLIMLTPTLDLNYLQASVESLSGVKSVRINGPAFTLVVEYDGSPAVRAAIIKTLQFIPDEAFLDNNEKKHDVDLFDVGARTAVAAATPFLPVPVQAATSWMLAIPGIVQGLETLFTRGVKIEVLDGTVKTLSMLRGDYFTSNSVGALLSLGEYLEDQSEQKSTDLLKTLLKPQVDKIWIEQDGREIEIDFKDLKVGNIVICGPGELIPIEGTIIEGDGSINQSSITGESVPVHLQPGDATLSGAVVEEGTLKIRADKVGAETGMARINRFLESSLRSQSKSQVKSAELADKLVPLTFGAGLGVYALTRDAARAASVLTVDYSCAIKLSTPVATRTSMYTASQAGVLLKGGQALDNLAAIDTLVFDKTGTLTKGELKVTDLVPMPLFSEEELLSIAAGAEEHYAHPVARAVVNEAKERDIALPDVGGVDFIVAHGVSAYVDGKRVLVGSQHFVEEDEKVNCAFMKKKAQQLRNAGKNLLFVAMNEKLIGLIAMRDELRPEALEALEAFKAAGIKRIEILTGDHRSTALALAAQLPPVDAVHWELKPEDKAAIVKDLKKGGAKVGFAGDGVNDTPALVCADVGICMPSGADLARESAQVIMLNEDMRTLVEARRIAVNNRETLSSCLWSAVVINSATLLLAGMGKISTLAAAMTHNLSTVGILGYAALKTSNTTYKAEPLESAKETT